MGKFWSEKWNFIHWLTVRRFFDLPWAGRSGIRICFIRRSGKDQWTKNLWVIREEFSQWIGFLMSDNWDYSWKRKKISSIQNHQRAKWKPIKTPRAPSHSIDFHLRRKTRVSEVKKGKKETSLLCKISASIIILLTCSRFILNFHIEFHVPCYWLSCVHGE